MNRRRIADARQVSLFNDDPVPDTASESVPVCPSFDPAKLQIIEYESEPCVLDIDLGAALGYGRPDRVRRLIKRLTGLQRFGKLRHRDATSSGQGARSDTVEFLLTENQVIRVCMACRLPNLDEVQALIADVFIAWRHGKLRPVDAKTEVNLIDSADRAIDAAPELFNLLHQLAANDNSIRQEMHERFDGVDQQLAALGAKGRNDFSKKAENLWARVLERWYGGLDPAQGKYKLTDGNGHLLPNVHRDHWNDRATDNRTENGWPLHPATHKRKTAGEDFHAEFRLFLKRCTELWDEEEKRQPNFLFVLEDAP